MSSTGSVAAARPLSRAARRRRRSRRVARTLLVAVLAVLVGLTTFVGGLLAAPADFDQDLVPEQKSVLLLANDGKTQFASIPPPTRRQIVPASAIPEVMRQAIISAEDERFLEHQGVDPLATIRAAYRDLSGGRTQGGSTLTQQYVKNAYVGSDRTLLRKVREAALAVRLENEKSKEEILTDYLNALYLGNGVYGVQAAAKYYFGVEVKDLDLDEGRGRRDKTLALARAALLAGIAPAPSAWNPVKDFATAKVRQKYTLNRMVVAGYIQPADASDASLRGVTPVRETPPEPPTNAPEFADLVKAQLRDTFAEDEDVLFRGGLRVKTTLDVDLQEAVSRAAREVLPDDDDPQAAVVAVDIRNGDVKAMTTLRRVPEILTEDGPVPGTSGYKRDGYNLATNAFRSAGSTIKPFTLAAALAAGRSMSETRFAPQCAPYRDQRETDEYCNSDGGQSGRFSLRSALARSVNTVYVPLADEVGHGKVRQLMLDSGVRALDPDGEDGRRVALDPGPESFGLGTTALVTPLSMASAYGTLANHGVRMPPRFFSELRAGAAYGGGLVEQSPGKPKGSRALPVEVADQVTEAMRDAVTRGTARAAAQPFEVFGKTGTTNDSKDAWFVGCARSPQNVCLAVWMGYEKTANCDRVNGPCGGMLNVNGVKQVYGGTLPARIFARSFEVLREIQADRAARMRGEEPAARATAATSSESATPRRRRTAEAEPTRRARRSTSPAPAEQSAAPASPAAPTAEPEPEPPPSEEPPPSSPPPILPPPPGTGGDGDAPASPAVASDGSPAAG